MTVLQPPTNSLLYFVMHLNLRTIWFCITVPNLSTVQTGHRIFLRVTKYLLVMNIAKLFAITEPPLLLLLHPMSRDHTPLYWLCASTVKPLWFITSQWLCTTR
jgi:hypothetical protein